MYNAGYGYGGGAPNFNTNGAQQGMGQPGGQQVMFSQQQQQQPQQQQQFPGMGSQGGNFQGAGNPQMMAGPQGMMQSMPMNANGQMAFPQQFPGAQYGQMAGGMNPQNFNNNFMMGGMQGFPMNQGGMPQQQQPQQQQQQQQQQQHQPPQAQQPQQQQQHHQQQQQQQQPQQQQHPQQHHPQQPPQQQQQPPPQQQNAQQRQRQQQQQQLHQQQQQQMMQRIQQQQQMNQGMGQMGTPQRPQSATQGTPQMTPQQHPQYQTSQSPHMQGQNHTPQGFQQSTPQPPHFMQQVAPSPAQGPTHTGGNDAMEKERFALLLDINHELLYESIQLQATQQELKKEHVGNNQGMEGKPTEEESLLQQDYLQCMRRLQANLTYMAALADKKPEVKVPPSPAYLSAPNLNLSLRLRAQPLNPDVDPSVDRESREHAIKDLYHRLQAAFPGVDPKKEPMARPGGPGQHKQGMPSMSQVSPAGQRTPQMGGMQGMQQNQSGVPS